LAPLAHVGGPATVQAGGALGLTFIARLRGTGVPIRRTEAYADAVRAGHGNIEGLPLLLEHRERLQRALTERREHSPRSTARSPRIGGKPRGATVN